jgi:hypothetical protein
LKDENLFLLPDGVDSVLPSSAVDLCKPGDETPMTMIGGGGPPKQLYRVLRRRPRAATCRAARSSHPTTAAPEGAASILSKSAGTGVGGGGAMRARTMADKDEADKLGKKFKF